MCSKIYGGCLVLAVGLCLVSTLALGRSPVPEPPLTITADTITHYQNDNKTEARGGVVAQKGAKRVESDALDAYFYKQGAPKPTTDIFGSASLNKLVATSPQRKTVHLFDGQTKVRGTRAVHDVPSKVTVVYGPDIRVVSEQILLDCQDTLVYEETLGKLTARGEGNLKHKKQGYEVVAPMMEAYFEASGPHTAAAAGNNFVGQQGQKLNKAAAAGGVRIVKGEKIATGDRATYDAKTEKIELYDNVKITDKDQKLSGGYGYWDMRKGISKVFATKPSRTAEKNAKSKPKSPKGSKEAPKQVKMLLHQNKKA